MNDFLTRIAQAYLRRERRVRLSDICFVFPDRRPKAFMERALARLSRRPSAGPQMMTISQLVERLSPQSVTAPRFDRLLLLFNQYKAISEGVADFDRFRFWGEMVLNDFDEVDRHLLPPDKVFENVREFTELRSDYLSDEQRKIISLYWGDDALPPKGRSDFWLHMQPEGEDTTARKSFREVWRVLAELYNGYTSALRAEGLASPGMLCRRAAEVVSSPDFSPQWKRYVFVGFAFPRPFEIAIFKTLKKRGLLDFYVDYHPGMLGIGGADADGEALLRLRRDFPPLHDLEADAPPRLFTPKLTVKGVPSVQAQARVVRQTLEQWVDDKTISRPADALDTCVVLPDESMFISLTHNIPTAFEHINVTMSFPLRDTPIASLIDRVLKMQARVRRTSAGLRSFFEEDVKELLLNPIVRSLDTPRADAILREIAKKRLFRIVPSDLEAPGFGDRLAPIFKPIGTRAAADREIYDYLKDLLDHLEEHSPEAKGLGNIFIEGYRSALIALRKAMDHRGVNSSAATFVALLRGMVGSFVVPLQGNPVRGLQIMGMPDTRTLDFENVIVTSMNERIYPRRSFNRSFIPPNLRAYWGLPTNAQMERIQAYDLFRLISRAKNVTLIYDTRTGSQSGEMSRYITRLLYLSGLKDISHSTATFPSVAPRNAVLEIRRNDKVRQALNRFLTEGSNYNLSPSAINTYLSCPMKFYLQIVERRNLDNEITSFIDASTYGTIVHGVMERIYCRDHNTANLPTTVTPEQIRDILSNADANIFPLIRRVINITYNNIKEEDTERIDTPLSGEADLMARMILRFIRGLLNHDRTIAPFQLLNAEELITDRWDIGNGMKVNMKMYIDRVDRVGGALRVIDYKTGGDVTAFNDISQLFDPERKERPKAILQLLLYALFYQRKHPADEPITPMVYQLKTLLSKGINHITFDKQTLTDHRPLMDEFVARINALLQEIFCSDEPFRQASTSDPCSFCAFRVFCRK